MPAAALPASGRQLSRAIDGLVAISTSPTIWTDGDAGRIVESVAQVLATMLDLEFAFVSLRQIGGGAPIRLAHTRDPGQRDPATRIAGAIAAWPLDPPPADPVELANPIGPGTVRIVFQPIGPRRYGVIACAARRGDFPTSVQRLLLGAAAHQAAIALERRQASDALQQLNETLDQRVATEIRQRMKLGEAFSQTQKMEAIGQLTGGVAHDFNNLLTAIWGSLELLERHVTSASGRRLLQTATRAAHRGAELTEKLLAFSRKQLLLPSPVDLNKMLAERREQLERSAGPKVKLRLVLAPELWPGMVDPTQIELAVRNLAVNSGDAMPQGGELTITTANVAIAPPGDSADRATVHRAPADRAPADRATVDLAAADLAPGDYIAISVADTGTGIAPELLGRVLEPFFTTKDVGKGSGLGLSMVYGLMKQSGGSLRIDSEVGRGTLVELLLPRA
jgi:signal transduction histidine kinase